VQRINHEVFLNNDQLAAPNSDNELHPPPAAAAPGIDAGALGFDEFVPCRFREDDWEPDGPPDENDWQAWCRDWCFFCDTTQDPHQYTVNGEYLLLQRLITDHYSSMDMRTLCAKVQAEYNKHLRPYAPGQREWTVRSIRDHITEHAPSDYVMTAQAIRTINSCMTTLQYSGLCSKNTRKPDERTLNAKNGRLYLDLVKSRQALMRDAERLRPHTSNL
jgi:hypothetical protein